MPSPELAGSHVLLTTGWEHPLLGGVATDGIISKQSMEDITMTTLINFRGEAGLTLCFKLRSLDVNRDNELESLWLPDSITKHDYMDYIVTQLREEPK